MSTNESSILSDDVKSKNDLSENEMSKNYLSKNEMSENNLTENEMSENNLSENEMSENEKSENEMSENEMSECECADLVLSDGRRGDCSKLDPISNRLFCFVKTSPCVIRDESGSILEGSIPDPTTNGLLHVSYSACNKRNV